MNKFIVGKKYALKLISGIVPATIIKTTDKSVTFEYQDFDSIAHALDKSNVPTKRVTKKTFVFENILQSKQIYSINDYGILYSDKEFQE